MIDAAVGASAHRVIAVTPWFGYSRQDKKSAPREPISARLVARMLENAGADRVLAMDLHAGQVQGFFPKPMDHMTALFMLTQYFNDLHLEDLVVVSPDAGRVKLAKKFASKIGAELAILNKERPAQQVAEIGYVIGDVEGKTALLVDDMIDTAGTLRAAGQTVMDEGATRVYAAATHGVFSGNGGRTWRPRTSSRSSSRTRSRCAPARPPTSACSRAPTCSRTRSAASSPTTPCPRSSVARTSSSRAPRGSGAARPHRRGADPTLDASALELLGGELDHRPELAILLDLLADAEERAGATMLPRWVRASGPARPPGRPAHGAGLRPLRGRGRRRWPSDGFVLRAAMS